MRFQVLLEVATQKVIFPRQLGPFQICHIWSLLFVIVIVYARCRVVSKAKKLGKVECQTKRTTLPGSKAASGVSGVTVWDVPVVPFYAHIARDRVVFSRRRAFSHKAQTINLKLSYWPRSPQRQISCRITVFFYLITTVGCPIYLFIPDKAAMCVRLFGDSTGRREKCSCIRKLEGEGLSALCTMTRC